MNTGILCHFAIIMNKDTCCNDNVVTCEWQCCYYCI